MRGHHPDPGGRAAVSEMRMVQRRLTLTVPCACGCGASVSLRQHNGRWMRFVHGHNARVQHFLPVRIGPRGWYKPESRNPNTGHERARKLKRRDACELARIGGCLGRVEVHHKDKDPGNNAPENLMAICQSHHTLLDAERIDPAAPVMPPFYVDRRGKRRYVDGWLRGRAWAWRRAQRLAAVPGAPPTALLRFCYGGKLPGGGDHPPLSPPALPLRQNPTSLSPLRR